MKLYELTKSNVNMYLYQIGIIKILYRALRSDIEFKKGGYDFKGEDYERKELKRLLRVANRGLSKMQNGHINNNGSYMSANLIGGYYKTLDKILIRNGF